MAYYASNPRRQPYDASPKTAARARVVWFGGGAAFGLLAAALATSILHRTPAPLKVSFPDAPLTAEAPAALPLQALPLSKPAPAYTWPRILNVEVEQGDSLLNMLVKNGVAYKDGHALMQQIKPVFNPRKLRQGTEVALTLVRDNSRTEAGAATLGSMKVVISPLESLIAQRRPNGSYTVFISKEKTQPKVSFEEGTITSSFYVAMQRSGVASEDISRIIRAYSYDVDFQRDIQRGDRFQVMYEKMVTKEGAVVGTGRLLFAQLLTGDRELNLYPYQDASGAIQFYNEKGISVTKKLLRTPLDVVRITSGFGMRMHPVLGYSRMHKGVDFAAGTGTPIFAAGDGTVAFAGQKSGYGNFVLLKHQGAYETAYGHASRIAKGIKNGARVKQGQVIAYVGATGRATGPHLHYEIRQNHAQVNPASVKFMGKDRLSGRQLASFRQHIARIDQQVAALGGTVKSRLVAAR